MNKKLIRTLRILVILILVLINLIILRSNLVNKNSANNTNTNKTNNNETSNNITETNSNKSINSVIENKISKMNESSRAQTYFGEFIEAIDDQNYTGAYNMLNDEYKNNYFPNQSDFENYLKTSFPQGNLAIEYNGFDKKGDIYVLDVNIYSINDTNNKINKTAVIRENGLNDFKISFSK